MPHHILPGSLEVDGTTVVAGVHTGAHEWDVQNTGLRYIRASMVGGAGTLMDLLAKTYDNSEGCLITHTFKMRS
jgi:hypothetical protein